VVHDDADNGNFFRSLLCLLRLDAFAARFPISIARVIQSLAPLYETETTTAKTNSQFGSNNALSSQRRIVSWPNRSNRKIAMQLAAYDRLPAILHKQTNKQNSRGGRGAFSFDPYIL